MEQTECGAACLAIILAYYGRYVSLVELRLQCGVSRDGSKASNLVQAARHYGMDAKGYRKEMERLDEVMTPCIVFWQFNHFLVVEKFGRRHVHINDPARGHYRLTRDEFEEGFTGVVLLMQPGSGFRRSGHPPRLWRALWRRIRRFWISIVFIVLCGCLLLIPGIALPSAIGVFIDEVIQETRIQWLRPLVMLVMGLLAFQLTVLWLQSVVLRRLLLTVSTVGTTRFLWQALRLPYSFYQQRYAGEVAARIIECDRIAEVLAMQLPLRIVDLFSTVAFATVLCLHDQTLFSIAVLQAIIVLGLVQMIAFRRRENNLRVSQEESKLSGVAIAGIQNMDTIRMTGSSDGFFVRIMGHLARVAVARSDVERMRVTYRVLPDLASSLATTMILIVGGYKVIAGELSLGGLFAFQALCNRFLASSRSLISFIGVLHDVHGSIMRLEDIETTQVDQQFFARPTVDHGLTLRGDIRLRTVTFGFSPLDPPVVKNISLQVAPGQRIALVGGSGSGKSSIARLIAGLYTPQSGEVEFDGRLRNTWPTPTLSNSIAMVDQDVFLFEGTVRENLTLWDATIPDRDLIDACMDAEIWDVIQSLPGGLDAILQENGSNLSGGQRQRLEIARSLVGNPIILIFDEATSALDEATEAAVLTNLTRRGCTTISVAHRLSTIRDSDRIFVIHKGEIVEQGDHSELMLAEGHYSQLIQAEEQFT